MMHMYADEFDGDTIKHIHFEYFAMVYRFIWKFSWTHILYAISIKPCLSLVLYSEYAMPMFGKVFSSYYSIFEEVADIIHQWHHKYKASVLELIFNSFRIQSLRRYSFCWSEMLNVFLFLILFHCSIFWRKNSSFKYFIFIHPAAIIRL